MIIFILVCFWELALLVLGMSLVASGEGIFAFLGLLIMIPGIPKLILFYWAILGSVKKGSYQNISQFLSANNGLFNDTDKLRLTNLIGGKFQNFNDATKYGLRNRTAILLLSIFASPWDRFLTGRIGTGIIKIITFNGGMIWYLFDIFTAMNVTSTYNFTKFTQKIAFEQNMLGNQNINVNVNTNRQTLQEVKPQEPVKEQPKYQSDDSIQKNMEKLGL